MSKNLMVDYDLSKKEVLLAGIEDLLVAIRTVDYDLLKKQVRLVSKLVTSRKMNRGQPFLLAGKEDLLVAIRNGLGKSYACCIRKTGS